MCLYHIHPYLYQGKHEFILKSLIFFQYHMVYSRLPLTPCLSVVLTPAVRWHYLPSTYLFSQSQYTCTVVSELVIHTLMGNIIDHSDYVQFLDLTVPTHFQRYLSWHLSFFIPFNEFMPYIVTEILLS